LTRKNVVLVESQLHPAAMTSLKQSCQVMTEVPAKAVSEAISSEIKAAIVSARWHVDGGVLDRFPVLLVIARTGIGVDNVDVEAATDRGVAVVNTPDAPSRSTAEHSVSLLMALAKRHRTGLRILTTGGSLQNEAPGIELEGKVLGLVGLGRVGAAMATICRSGLGMKVIAYDPYLPSQRAAALGVALKEDLDELLRESDFVSLHLPATAQTHRIIDARALAVLRPGTYLINCSRGSLIDEQALVEALSSGRLAGAGLDVFDPEPPSPANPLLQMENVVVTPHAASYTDDARRGMGLAAVEQVLAVLHGRRPKNLVNPDVWVCESRYHRVMASSES
jgi:D-3-phosphoglycerate dehydrogenase